LAGACPFTRHVEELAPIYSSAIPDCKKEETLRKRCRHRTVQYLNNILEQDHRAIKRRVNAKQRFREFQAARRTIQGYEAIHMIRKGQVRWVAGDDLLRQIRFIDSLSSWQPKKRTTDARQQTCLHLKLATPPLRRLSAGIAPVFDGIGLGARGLRAGWESLCNLSV